MSNQTQIFTKGDEVEVIPDAGDDFHKFVGTVIGYRQTFGFVQVRDQDDNVWDVYEHQCTKVDKV